MDCGLTCWVVASQAAVTGPSCTTLPSTASCEIDSPVPCSPASTRRRERRRVMATLSRWATAGVLSAAVPPAGVEPAGAVPSETGTGVPAGSCGRMTATVTARQATC